MTRWEVFQELRAAMRDPARIGDIPAYKSELGRTRARPEVEAQLGPVRGYRPAIDLEALARLEPGTLGHEYQRFLAINGLTPIVMSERVDPELAARNAFVIRYGTIHDMVHVLTGFDASWPGEVGVWAFVGGQRYSRGFQITAVVALLAALFRCPLRLGEAWRSFRRGWAMGEAAELVISQRLEEQFEVPVAEIRVRLGIVGARDEYALDGSK